MSKTNGERYFHFNQEIGSNDALCQLLDALDGKRPPRIINPEVWPRYAERFKQAFGVTPG